MELVLADIGGVEGYPSYGELPTSRLCPRECWNWLFSFCCGGDGAGACGRGLRDCRIFLYVVSGFGSEYVGRFLERSSIAEGAIPVASLRPRLCELY